MERALFVVASSYSGWQLYDQEQPRNWFPDKLAALMAAHKLAEMRHTDTGRPTGVKVQMSRRDEDWVLVGMRG